MKSKDVKLKRFEKHQSGVALSPTPFRLSPELEAYMRAEFSRDAKEWGEHLVRQDQLWKQIMKERK